MNINATRRLHSRFSPESKIECCLIWQVFWLGVYFNAFPLIKIVAKIEASRKPLLRRGLGRPLTATGIAPDLHRTSLLICLIIMYLTVLLLSSAVVSLTSAF